MDRRDGAIRPAGRPTSGSRPRSRVCRVLRRAGIARAVEGDAGGTLVLTLVVHGNRRPLPAARRTSMLWLSLCLLTRGGQTGVAAARVIANRRSGGLVHFGGELYGSTANRFRAPAGATASCEARSAGPSPDADASRSPDRPGLSPGRADHDMGDRRNRAARPLHLVDVDVKGCG